MGQTRVQQAKRITWEKWMRDIFIASFILVASLGLAVGCFIPGDVLVFFWWLNFLVAFVLTAAWSKEDQVFTASILIWCGVFWLSAYGGRMLSVL